MIVLFAIAAIIAVIATVLAISRNNVVHALLYLVVSLLAVAVAMYALGAPYLAALEVIIYAGAIMVLFVFVTMMLNLGDAAKQQERRWQPPRGWIGPAILAIILLLELVWMLVASGSMPAVHTVGPEAVGRRLIGDYVIGVELASMLLLGAVVAAYHLGVGLNRKQDQDASAAEANSSAPYKEISR